MSDLVLKFSMQRGLPVTRTLVLCALLCTIVSAEPRHEFTPDSVSKYYFEDGTIRYCQPILQPNSCGIDHHIIPCTKDGLLDQCVPCRPGHINLDISYSDFPIECYTTVCPEGTVPAERRSSSNCDLLCECDESSGYTGSDPCLCKRVDFLCGENTYLKDGVCTACEDRTYKRGFGYGPCLPVTPTTASPNLHEKKVSSSTTPMSVMTGALLTTGKNPTAVEEKPEKEKDSDFDVKPEDNNIAESGSGQTAGYGILITILVIVALILVIAVTAVCIRRNLISQEGHIVNNVSCLSNLRCIFTRIYTSRQGNDNTRSNSVRRTSPDEEDYDPALAGCPTISSIPEHHFSTFDTTPSSSAALLVPGTDGDETELKTAS